MQAVYRIISRDYKHNYDYFTTSKELFDLVDNGDGIAWPEMPQELQDKYDTEDVYEAIYREDISVEFPYIILDETTIYVG